MLMAHLGASYVVLLSGIPHESVLFSQYAHKPLGECYTKKIQVTSGVFYYIYMVSVDIFWTFINLFFYILATF